MLKGIAAGPVRPPYGRQAERTTRTPRDQFQTDITPAEATPDRPNRKPTAAHISPDYARRKRLPKQSATVKTASEAFTPAKEMTVRAAHDICRQFGERLTRDDCVKLVSAFRSGIVPRRKAGRRPKPQVTAAYLDWKAGMRGVALFRKHIPGWDRHNRYHRIGEQKALMDAIRSRGRRAREHA